LDIPLHYAGTPESMTEPPRASVSDQDPLPSNQPLVLAIDDDPDVIFLLRENLSEAGYAVIGATGGAEGVQKAKTLQPFAITLDVMMPHVDGWQVLADLKSDPVTRDIPVVLLTIVDKRRLGYQMGAADYLLKPFDGDEMVSALRRLARFNHGVAPRHLLVVDDDPNVCDMLKQMLDGAEYQIESAANGEDALEAMSRHKPEAVLLDLIMPLLDGFGVIERMRAQTELAGIPILVLTSKILTADESARLSKRISKVIHKDGLDGRRLAEELQRVLKTYRE
jgi:CheY-like chemotaxis protein